MAMRNVCFKRTSGEVVGLTAWMQARDGLLPEEDRFTRNYGTDRTWTFGSLRLASHWSKLGPSIGQNNSQIAKIISRRSRNDRIAESVQ
jgi:hypothetical protein